MSKKKVCFQQSHVVGKKSTAVIAVMVYGTLKKGLLHLFLFAPVSPQPNGTAIRIADSRDMINVILRVWTHFWLHCPLNFID